MFVYALVNRNTPCVPFYIGITGNPSRRLQQHRTSDKHKRFASPDEIVMRVLLDTGNNEYSKVLSEQLEINLIQYYDTFRY